MRSLLVGSLSAAAAAFVLAPVPAARAGVALVSAQRSISVTTTIPFETKTESSTALGLFDEVLSAEVFDDQDNDRSFVDVGQQSSVTSDALSAAGFLEIENLGEATGATTRFLTVFDVTQPTAFELSYRINAVTSNVIASGEEQGRVQLRRTDGSAEDVVGPDQFTFGRGDLNEGPEPDVAFDGNGTLAPGRYEMLLEIDAPFDDFGFNGVDTHVRAEYSMSLEFGNSNGGGEPNPIPLPPAVWSGLTVLGAGALNRVRKTRRRG